MTTKQMQKTSASALWAPSPICIFIFCAFSTNFNIGHTWFKVRHYLNFMLIRRKLDQAKFNIGQTWHKYALGHTFAAAERRTSCHLDLSRTEVSSTQDKLGIGINYVVL